MNAATSVPSSMNSRGSPKAVKGEESPTQKGNPGTWDTGWCSGAGASEWPHGGHSASEVIKSNGLWTADTCES